MMRTSLAIGLLCVTASAIAQEKSTADLHELLESAKLPEGLQATTRNMLDGDKKLGYVVILSKPDQVSKVLVRIELTDRPTIPMRRAAVKAYVNTFAEALNNDGFRIVEKSFPDLAKETFEKPVSLGALFANDEGKKLWMHQEIFFTNKTFAVQVIADDPKTLTELTAWAKTVKAKGK